MIGSFHRPAPPRHSDGASTGGGDGGRQILLAQTPGTPSRALWLSWATKISMPALLLPMPRTPLKHNVAGPSLFQKVAGAC